MLAQQNDAAGEVIIIIRLLLAALRDWSSLARIEFQLFYQSNCYRIIAVPVAAADDDDDDLIGSVGKQQRRLQHNNSTAAVVGRAAESERKVVSDQTG